PRGLPAITGATTGQRRQSTVANDGQRRRTTTGPSVNGGRPPVNGGQRWWLTGLWAGSSWVLGRVRLGLGPGRDRVGPGLATWYATWYHVSADVAVDVAWMG
ncbi:hypothetical protein Tco_0502336, partial [Tanacetum coccineum]